jgi:nicotinate-nucleotide adenylyltransferase
MTRKRPAPRSDTEETLAIFGGSFDPPHVAHVLVATYVLATEDVDRVLAIPTCEHSLDKAATASFEHRVRMTELAMKDLARVTVSSIEGELGGKSRTLLTLEELARRMPRARFRLVIGADILLETERWYRFDRVRELAPLIVVGRAGYESPDDTTKIDLPRVSSTEIRARLAADRPVAGLVPRRVEEHIRLNGLYGVKAAP